MTPELFNHYLRRRLEKIGQTLGQKAGEYASGQDRLHNFKLAARVNGTTPAKALWGMASKHLVSIMDMVDGRQPVTDPMIDEKIGDMVNYLVLLEAIFRDGRTEP